MLSVNTPATLAAIMMEAMNSIMCDTETLAISHAPPSAC
jgi:hypothetical protein